MAAGCTNVFENSIAIQAVLMSSRMVLQFRLHNDRYSKDLYPSVVAQKRMKRPICKHLETPHWSLEHPEIVLPAEVRDTHVAAAKMI